MKTGKSIIELATEIDRRAQTKRDYLVESPELYMGDNTRLYVPGNGNFEVGNTAHRQIGSHLKIPAAYYDTMRSMYPDLLAENVNYLMRQHKDETRMVRTLDGKARAFLSDRYRRIDNEDIANVVLPILMEHPDLEVISAEITERRMYIVARFPRVTGMVKVGRAVQAALMISNSEIGLGTFQISPMVYELACLNGMVTSHAMRKYHVGARAEAAEGSYEIFTEETVKADDKALMLKVRDVVRASMDQAVLDDSIIRLRAAAAPETEVEDPVKAVEALAKKTGLLEKESKSVLKNLIKDGDLTKYGLAQAVTAVANTDVVDYDRAVELQTLGGKLIDLPKSQYEVIRTAA